MGESPTALNLEGSFLANGYVDDDFILLSIDEQALLLDSIENAFVLQSPNVFQPALRLGHLPGHFPKPAAWLMSGEEVLESSIQSQATLSHIVGPNVNDEHPNVVMSLESNFNDIGFWQFNDERLTFLDSIAANAVFPGVKVQEGVAVEEFYALPPPSHAFDLRVAMVVDSMPMSREISSTASLTSIAA